MPTIEKIFGPPGTGKTHTLIELVKEEISNGVPIKYIGYLGFTKASAEEAFSRASKNIEMDSKLWFRTIHSACLYLLRRQGVKEDVTTFKHKKAFCDGIGIILTPDDDDTAGGDTTPLGNLFFSITSYLENTMLEPKYWEDAPNTDEFTLPYQNVYDLWLKFKIQNNIMDFTDMITAVIKQGYMIPVDVLFVDEFQDLSPLQFKVIEQFSQNVRNLYCSGDDDQAIYKFQGADPNIFLEYGPSKDRVLPKSYRLPKEVLVPSQKLIRQNKNRQEKEFLPREGRGEMRIVHSPPDYFYTQFLNKDCYFLLRTNKLASKLGWKLSNAGVPFKYLDGVKENMWGWSNKTNLDIYNKGLAYGIGSINQMVINNQILDMKANFISNYVISYKQPIDPSNIHTMLGTIHSAKGREADTVLLFDDITEKVVDNTMTPTGLEDERRVFYVGMTRAKRNLTIISHGIRSKGVFSFELPNRLGFR